MSKTIAEADSKIYMELQMAGITKVINKNFRPVHTYRQ